MFKINIFCFIFSFISFSFFAQELRYEASLLTISPGDKLYSTFGHSAIRIKNTNYDLDLVFDYGVFDFETSNFYIKFLSGKLDYILALHHYNDFVNYIVKEGRGIIENKLILTDSQLDEMVKFLEWNRDKENRYYKYDFFYDNCATRIRDIFIKQLKFRDIDNLKLELHEETFRTIIKKYLKSHPWSEFFIDLALGTPADVKVSSYDQAFIPSNLQEKLLQIKNYMMNSGLIGSTKIIHEAANKNYKLLDIILKWASPFNMFLVLTMIIILAHIKRWNILSTFYNYWFIVLGIIGVMISLLWFATDHNATKNNLNLLWGNPLYILMFVLTIRIWILRIALAISIFFILFWTLLPQQFHPAFYFISIISFMGICKKLNLKPFSN